MKQAADVGNKNKEFELMLSLVTFLSIHGWWATLVTCTKLILVVRRKSP